MSIQLSSIRIFITAFVVSLMNAISGFIVEWSSPMMKYSEDQTEPFVDVDKDDMTFLQLMPLMVGIIAPAFYGCFAEKYGRKCSLYLAGIFGIISGVLFVLAEKWEAVFFARMSSSLSMVGAVMICPMYLMEMAHESSRGIYVCMCSLQAYTGLLLAYLLGEFLCYTAFNAYLLIIPAWFLLLFFFLPESPYFLISKSRMEEAKKSLIWIRGGDSASIKQEMEAIAFLCNQTAETDLKFLKSKRTRNGLLIAIVLCVIRALSGNYEVRTFAHTFQDKKLTTEGVAYTELSLQLIASFLSSLSVDRAGRKIMLYVSFAGASTTLITASVYHYLQTDCFAFFPTVALYMFDIFYCLGYGTITNLIALEVSTIQTRCLMVSLAMTIDSLLGLGFIGIYYLFDTSHMVNFYWISIFANIIGCIFVWLIVPETAGKSLKEIGDELNSEEKQNHTYDSNIFEITA